MCIRDRYQRRVHGGIISKKTTMLEVLRNIVGFLEQTGLHGPAKVLNEEIQKLPKDKLVTDAEKANLMKIINQAIANHSRNEAGRRRENINPNLRRTMRLFTQEETENIMEKFMNKLVGQPNMLEDERLNLKIERFFDNQTFQKMVEATDVFNDLSNISFTNSILQKNNILKQSQKKPVNDPSWEVESLPHFGQQNDSEILFTDGDSLINPHGKKTRPTELTPTTEKNVPISVKPGKPPQREILENRSPSMEDLFNAKPIEETKKNKKPTPKPIVKSSEKKGDDPKGKSMDMPSIIQAQNVNDSSLFLNDGHSFVLSGLEDNHAVDEYVDDDDPGFDLYEVAEREFHKVCKQLADKYGFPNRAMTKDPKLDEKDNQKDQREGHFTGDEDSRAILKDLKELKDKKKEEEKGDGKGGNDSKKDDKKKQKGYILLPPTLKHPGTKDDFYPVEYDNIIYDCFNLKVIFDRERTGFEETKEFPIVINSTIAGRYQILEYLGSAAFSKAIQCLDLVTGNMVCMKVIENNKDYFDQSIDEIKLLRYINCNGDVDQRNVLKLYDYFYHKEHLFIITELLKENLYEFYKLNKESGNSPYFTIGRLQKITMQILNGLDYIHSLNLIHCDLKPENILMRDVDKCEVKIIDFGSSCFLHDHLSSYVQSRSYRAPEVIIGCKYDAKIDMWSLGCILAELFTGYVLFQNDTVQGLLARVIGIIGPFPQRMMRDGKLVSNFFTKERLLFQDVDLRFFSLKKK
eukprot:TRINITY_DN883_c0_g1_i2.p1 TRINITY_DN883_c0_g1~~TRINITY_DN883_c0_g1_i2.p1  ORF type:complete len:747 (-),score=216.15 TRINITY_DN883_c0_g1_i2:405-2645(-)